MTPTQLWRLASELKQDSIFTVITKTTGSTPRKEGSFIVTNNEYTFGTIGGGAIELKVLALAKKQLKDGVEFNNFSLELDGDSEATKLGVCGGIVTFNSYLLSDKTPAFAQAAKFSFEGKSFRINYDHNIDFNTELGIFYPATPQLMIFGGGHCGKALAHASSLLGYRCQIIDEVDFCKNESDYPPETLFSREDLSDLIWGETNCAVLLTRSWKKDVQILLNLQDKDSTYIGMMGSTKRILHVKEAFLTNGGNRDFYSSLHAPIGLNLNAQSPEEIAISILAEIIQTLKK